SSCFQEQWARKAWDNSEVKAKLRSDVLMKCISKVRDIALHTANVSLENRKFYYLVAAKGAPLEGEIVEIFITPIVSDKHTTKSKISHEEIQWFNRQVQSWPLKYLL